MSSHSSKNRRPAEIEDQAHAEVMLYFAGHFHFPEHRCCEIDAGLPNRNTGRDNLMLDHCSPFEPGLPAETSHGRRCCRTPNQPHARFSTLGSFPERSLKVRRLLWGAGARGAYADIRIRERYPPL